MRFTKDHKFLLISRNIAKIGLTDLEIEHIGTPSFISLPKIGSLIKKQGDLIIPIIF